MKEKQITNEDLAQMIKKGFDGSDEKFEGIDKRFDDIEVRLENIEAGQEDIKLRLGEFAYRFEVEDLKKRLEKVEAKLAIK